MGGLVRWVLLGAVAFWVPSVALHAVVPCDQSWAIPRWSTVIPPATSLAAFLITMRGRRRPVEVALAMVGGVWLLGAGPMLLSATLCGAGFRQGLAMWLPTLLLGTLPPYAYIMATYDGALAGLGVVTLLLPGASLALERARGRAERGVH